MRLATINNGTPDGHLVVVSTDGTRQLATPVANLLEALEQWTAVEPDLLRLKHALDGGAGDALDPSSLRAPLPRTWQWLDGSAFHTHGELMQVAFGLAPIDADRPLMYQGMSDRFYGPTDPVPFPRECDGIDFEGEFGVIVDFVPMGTNAQSALKHIRLVVQINDWSLRSIAPIEMKTGFGWVQAKPACSMAPYAVTPDALGPDWRDGQLFCDLSVELNDQQFGRVSCAQMAFSFAELIAHAAHTRDLVAGTVIGSGTVSNREYADRGSACISERRAIEMIETGMPQTPFMSFGDKVKMCGVLSDGSRPFGDIQQSVVQY
jgi:fumarylacetoacetate (FAA) hydrolase